MTRIAFTGHRPKDLCGYDKSKYTGFVSGLAEYLKGLCDTDGETVFITGGAQGFDQLAFWAVDIIRRNAEPEDKNRILNEVYVPFPGQADRWTKTGLFSRDGYEKMLNRATKVSYCRQDTPSGRDAISALMSRNHDMVNNADIIIALFEDETWSNFATKSGTAECMRYAKAKGKKIIRLAYKTSPALQITGIVAY